MTVDVYRTPAREPCGYCARPMVLAASQGIYEGARFVGVAGPACCPGCLDELVKAERAVRRESEEA